MEDKQHENETTQEEQSNVIPMAAAGETPEEEKKPEQQDDTQNPMLPGFEQVLLQKAIGLAQCITYASGDEGPYGINRERDMAHMFLDSALMWTMAALHKKRARVEEDRKRKQIEEILKTKQYPETDGKMTDGPAPGFQGGV